MKPFFTEDNFPASYDGRDEIIIIEDATDIANRKVQPVLERLAAAEEALRGCIRTLERDASCTCDDTFEGDCNSCQSDIAAKEARAYFEKYGDKP